jgi:hypothetical protein
MIRTTSRPPPLVVLVALLELGQELSVERSRRAAARPDEVRRAAMRPDLGGDEVQRRRWSMRQCGGGGDVVACELEVVSQCGGVRA